MTLWAIHPHPCNDEVLSSWITRIAHENQMKTSTFCKVALNAKPRQLIDIDYREGEDIIQTLSEGTGIEIDRIRETSLLSEYRYVFGDFHFIPISWVVPTKYKRQALSPGLNFCPQCLDEEPYFRKSWRFAFYPVCTSHSIVLRQFCPQCQKPFQYIDSSHLAFGTSPITICKYCEFDIRHSPAEANIKSINECTTALQEILREGINFDSFAMPGHGHVRALEYLSELRRTMSLCSHSKYADWIIQRYRHEIPQEIDIATRMITQNYRRLEERSPMELSVIMALASTIMKDWPARCEEFDLAHNFSVRHQGKKLPTPYGFDNLKGGTQPEYEVKFSSEEILSARRILYRKLGKFPSQKELELFMADGVVRFVPQRNSLSSKEVVISPEHFVLEASKSLEPSFKAARYTRTKKVDSNQFKKIRAISSTQTQPPDSLYQTDMFDDPKKPLL
jgi:hypothetical protein